MEVNVVIFVFWVYPRALELVTQTIMHRYIIIVIIFSIDILSTCYSQAARLWDRLHRIRTALWLQCFSNTFYFERVCSQSVPLTHL